MCGLAMAPKLQRAPSRVWNGGLFNFGDASVATVEAAGTQPAIADTAGETLADTVVVDHDAHLPPGEIPPALIRYLQVAMASVINAHNGDVQIDAAGKGKAGKGKATGGDHFPAAVQMGHGKGKATGGAHVLAEVQMGHGKGTVPGGAYFPAEVQRGHGKGTWIQDPGEAEVQRGHGKGTWIQDPGEVLQNWGQRQAGDVLAAQVFRESRAGLRSAPYPAADGKAGQGKGKQMIVGPGRDYIVSVEVPADYDRTRSVLVCPHCNRSIVMIYMVGNDISDDDSTHDAPPCE